MDKTVEEFSKVVEQEEKELQSPESSPQLKKTRKGRIIVPPNLDMPEPHSSAVSPVTPNTAKPKPKLDSGSTSVPDQTTMISELMKKNPDLFKGNKPVKIKVMTKDANGKSTVKFITVKASPAAAATPTTSKGASPVIAKKTNIDLKTSPKTPSQTKIKPNIGSPNQSTPNSRKATERFGIRNTPNVIYTGRRGRPPKVKPGQEDPHIKERQEIAEKFSNASTNIVIQTEKSTSTNSSGKVSEDTYTTFDQVN